MNDSGAPPESKRLMMEIEIKFGKGRSDRVHVHYGDDPAELAMEFVQRHRLKESSIPVITKYIETTMETFMNQPRVPRRAKEPSGSQKDLPGKEAEKTPPPVPPTNVPVESAATPSPPPSPTPPPPPPPMSSFPTAGASRPSNREASPRSPARSFKPSAATAVGADEEHDSAEADILSRISRSLSVSMEQDRRMSHRTFSLRDIESELAAASQYAGLDSTRSVDSDNSTVAMNQPSQASVRDGPGTAERSWEHTSRRSPIPGIGFGGFAGSGTGYRSQRSNSPAPAAGESLDQHLGSDFDQYSHSYRMGDDATPLTRVFGSATSDRASFDRFSNYDGDVDGNDGERDQYAPSESDAASVAEAPTASAEEMYNRLKSATLHGHATTLSAHPPDDGAYFYENARSGGVPTASGRVLKPSGTTLQLGLRKGTLNNPTAATNPRNEKSLVGKSACERLHNAAQLDRNKRERRSKYAVDQELKALEKEKFKLNPNSQKIVANLRPKQYQQVHIGERLYQEGLVEKELKMKRADELKDKLTPEEWSCARCGTFQKIVNTAIVIQPLHQMQNKARILNNADEGSVKTSAPARICKECGWNQSEVAPHKPVNIALTLSDEAEELLRSRWQGNQPDPEDGGIHQYLYENARTRENIQQLNRVLWNEAHSGLTFAPVIPESSLEILERYKTAPAGDGPEKDNQTHPSGLHAAEKSILAGPAIGEYFSKSATERLSTTHTRPVLAAALKSYHAAGGGETASRASTLNPAHQEEFVNRLVYEYKDKRERQQKRSEYATRHDLSTGEELFKPQVGPDPAEALGLGTSRTLRSQKGSVFENIMEKDRILKLRKKEAEDRAAEALQRELQANQVKALETSQQILKQSTDSNIEELFQVLLEAQQEIIQDANANRKVDAESGNSDAPHWRTLLLDLDQVNCDLLIPEVGNLINEVRAVKINELNAGKNKKQPPPPPPSGTDTVDDRPLEVDVPNMLVSFASFRKLVLKCMKRRDGTGRSYVYVPKKKPDVAMQMIQEKLKEETFRPTIDRNSAILSMRRHKDLSEYPIEDVLHVEGERIRHKWESARQERILEASRELTFKPKLYKPPSYVKPKYWGMESQRAGAADGGSDSESEERKGDDDDQLRTTNAGVDDSSVVSSEAEQQVVQMPALQTRAAENAATGAKGAESQVSPPGSARDRDQRFEDRPPRPNSKSISPVRGRSDHAGPSRGQRGVAPPRMSVSPLSRGSGEDEHSINTISTKFTTDEAPPPPRLPADRSRARHTDRDRDRDGASGRSVDSAAPLVTRRSISSHRKSSTDAGGGGPMTPASCTVRSSALSASNARRSASGSVTGGAGRAKAASKVPSSALPPLPIDLAQGGHRPI